MNRRSIFKLLAGAACAAAIEITGLVPSLPKAAKYAVNPEYVNAAYEDIVISFLPPCPDMSVTLKKYPINNPLVKPWLSVDPDAYVKPDNPRYNLVNGQFVQIPQYLLES